MEIAIGFESDIDDVFGKLIYAASHWMVPGKREMGGESVATHAFFAWTHNRRGDGDKLWYRIDGQFPRAIVTVHEGDYGFVDETMPTLVFYAEPTGAQFNRMVKRAMKLNGKVYDLPAVAAQLMPAHIRESTENAVADARVCTGIVKDIMCDGPMYALESAMKCHDLYPERLAQSCASMNAGFNRVFYGVG